MGVGGAERRSGIALQDRQGRWL